MYVIDVLRVMRSKNYIVTPQFFVKCEMQQLNYYLHQFGIDF